MIAAAVVVAAAEVAVAAAVGNRLPTYLLKGSGGKQAFTWLPPFSVNTYRRVYCPSIFPLKFASRTTSSSIRATLSLVAGMPFTNAENTSSSPLAVLT